ncbi:helix-turn-helix domain-containing protein [Micromonospora aurantiaca (nom. illeg.)]|uniref:helix-turn-helix domain-containing protein n=1 Tax=Micromonospora aurantiaca (nom. illeg.) TaxID=47850 RepID=UPI003F49D1BD
MTELIARRVRKLREGKGWSATELAAAMTAAGVKWDRSVVANLETGRRRSVTVDEMFALAYVLDVAPVNLIAPVDDEWADYPVIAGVETHGIKIRDWIRGVVGLPGQDKRRYYAEVSHVETEIRDRLVAEMIAHRFPGADVEDKVRRFEETGERYIPVISGSTAGALLFSMPRDDDEGDDRGQR